MDSVRIFAGLDYHSESVQVCVMDASGKTLSNKSCANDAQAIRRQIEQYGTRCLVALEACSGAANLAEELKAFPNWTVNLAHPFYVSRFKKSLDKTDKQDAAVLADLRLQEIRRYVRDAYRIRGSCGAGELNLDVLPGPA